MARVARGSAGWNLSTCAQNSRGLNGSGKIVRTLQDKYEFIHQ